MVFDNKLLGTARWLYYSVCVMNETPEECSESDSNVGDYVSILLTDWEYAEECRFSDNDSLEAFVKEDIDALVEDVGSDVVRDVLLHDVGVCVI